MRTLEFYFDIISPYAYFGFKRLPELPEDVEVSLIPVLFAGLLGHWESKGPAEIPPKRKFTYQYTHWYAKRRGMRFKMPPAHPFNPLPGLRLALAADCEPSAIEKIFDYVWADGCSFDDQSHWEELTQSIGISDPAEALSSGTVKNGLRQNTEQAIAKGVFGVPTYLIEDQLFWGVDSHEMLLDYLAQPSLMNDPEMRRISDLPTSAERRPVAPKV